MTTGPEEGAAAGHGHFRAAHVDREHVIDMLKAAFVQGRLTKDELDARAGQALTARTYAELAALTADIPAGPPAARPPRQPVRPQDVATPIRPVRNAAIGSVSCLIVTGLAGGAALLDGRLLGLALIVAFLAALAVPGFIVCAVVDLWDLRRARRLLRPGPGGQASGGQRPGSTGHDPSPPGVRTDQTRTDQTRTDLRADRSRQDRPRPGGQGVPVVPRGARPTPGAA